MPICSACGEKFPLQIYNDQGKRIQLNSRKYCLDCNPLGEHRYHNGKKVDLVLRDESGKRLLKSRKFQCTTCGRTRVLKTRNKECTTCSNKRRRTARRLDAVKQFGGKCILCGYDTCLSALAFHHRNAFEKGDALSCMWGWASDRIEKELNKCVLLCQNCHAEVHEGIRKI